MNFRKQCRADKIFDVVNCIIMVISIAIFIYPLIYIAVSYTHLASILVRSFRVSYGGVQIAGLGAPYEDIGQAEEWTRTYIDQAYELGLMQGVSGTVFEPKSNLTRAQAATTLARFLKAIEPNAVSYTHLDVYKRQTIFQLYRPRESLKGYMPAQRGCPMK